MDSNKMYQTLPVMTQIIDGITRSGAGTFALTYTGGEWNLVIEVGFEAPDSPMCGAASYQIGETALEVMTSAVKEFQWDRDASPQLDSAHSGQEGTKAILKVLKEQERE